MPIIWMNPAASATQLPVPTDAEDCAAGEINGEGDVLGSCAYANGVYKTVRWSYPWTSTPIVLTSISGNANSHNGGVDMNDNGQIAGSYLGRDGFKHAFYWDPSTGTDAIDVPPLHGGYITTAVAIGNNGRVAGISETPGGLANAFHWLPGSSPVDDTPLPGGNNDAFVALSRDGTVAVGGSETAEHNEHAILEYLP